MNFDWYNYLTLAQDLIQLGNSHANEEAILRSTISRAYYAAYCKSYNYLRSLRINLGTSPNVHWTVINTLKNLVSIQSPLENRFAIPFPTISGDISPLQLVL